MRWCHMRGENNFGHNLVLNVMTINLNVLRTLMESGISSDEDSGLIITMHRHWRGRRDVEIVEKLSKPYPLMHSLSHSPILKLRARAWYYLLFPWFPSDEVTSNICAIACSRFIISLVTCMPRLKIGFDTEMTMSSIDEPSSWGLLDVC